MAELILAVEASAGVLPPTPKIGIDGAPVSPDANGVWKVNVAGVCGDGSLHELEYDLAGRQGETLKVTVTCGGTEVCKLEVKIRPGFIRTGGVLEFNL